MLGLRLGLSALVETLFYGGDGSELNYERFEAVNVRACFDGQAKFSREEGANLTFVIMRKFLRLLCEFGILCLLFRRNSDDLQKHDRLRICLLV